MPFNAGAIVGKAKIDNKQWGTGLKAMKKGLTVLSVGVGAAAALMTKATIKADGFQKSMSNVATVIDTGQISTQEMTKELLLLDPALGKTIDLTDALYQSFSAGAEDMEAALQTTEDAAKFSKAALTDVSTAVDVLTTASNAYGKEVVSTTQASDVFFTTIKEGKITGEQLSASIGKSIPLFAALNIPLEELGSGMAAMTAQGVNAAESTTQLNAIVNSFLKPSEAMTAALEAQGIASGSALLESEGLSGALAFLETATGGSKEELSRLLPSVEAVRGALALTGTGGEKFASILEEMESAAGATDEAFGKQEMTFETLSASLDKIEIVAGNVGKHFADKIAVGAIQAGAGVLDFIMSSRGMEIVGQVAGVAAGAFELLKSGITILVENLLPPMNDLWKTVTENILKLSGETEAGAGGMQLFSWAIEAVSMGLTLTSKVAEITITSIVDLVIAVKESAGAVGSFFEMLTGKVKFSEVKEQFAEAGEAFKTLGSNFTGGIVELIEETKIQFADFGVAVEETQLEITTNVQSTSEDAKEYVLSNWDEMLTGQAIFVGESGALLDQQETDVVTTNTAIEVSNTSLISKLKTSWAAYFAESKFSWKGLMTTIGSTLSFGLDSFSSLSSLYYANEKAEAEADKNAKLDALQTQFDQGLISQEDYEAATKAVNEEALADSNAIAEKEFKTKKKLDTAGAWMDAAGSIAGWWKQAPLLGPIAGPIWAGVMTGASTAMAITQTALINKQRFIPAREMGGMASGMTRINESGGEIVSLPDGSQVIPNDISRQIAADSGTSSRDQIFNISFSGARIDSKMDLRNTAMEVSKILGRELRKAG